jgi:hypothetical protein
VAQVLLAPPSFDGASGDDGIGTKIGRPGYRVRERDRRAEDLAAEYLLADEIAVGADRCLLLRG